MPRQTDGEKRARRNARGAGDDAASEREGEAGRSGELGMQDEGALDEGPGREGDADGDGDGAYGNGRGAGAGAAAAVRGARSKRAGGATTAPAPKATADGEAPVPEGGLPGRRRRAETTGALVLIGGACRPDGEALGAFLDLCGGREGGRIVAFTTASGDPVGSAHGWMRDFESAGAHDVEIPIVDRRDRAQDERIAAKVREARGIFLGGGDQVHLVATLGGSRVGRAIREAYAAGAVVGGTSAGAAALTETILAGGEHDEAGELSDMYMGPGFGLLGFRAMIDTHFAERRRLQRLFVAIAGNPELLGLGIDEDTAFVVRGHLGTVHGSGGVTFVDGRGVRFDNTNEASKRGAGMTLSYLRVGIVGPGYAFDLRERELEVILNARAEQEDTPTIRSRG